MMKMMITFNDKPQSLMVFAKYCILYWEKQSLEGGMDKVYPWVLRGLTKMLQTN